MKSFSSKKKVEILEICAGEGYGGLALALALKGRGVSVSITFTDIRGKVVENAKNIALEMGVDRVEAVALDAKEVNNLGKRFDIALMFGHSAPHFDPWDMLKVYASVSHVLVDNGVFILEETDRVKSILVNKGFKDVLIENPEKLVFSFHRAYNLVRGYYERSFVKWNSEKILTAKIYFWTLAELMALAWVFFEDVDLYRTEQYGGFIVAKNPRRKIGLEEFKALPTVLQRDPGDTHA